MIEVLRVLVWPGVILLVCGGLFWVLRRALDDVAASAPHLQELADLRGQLQNLRGEIDESIVDRVRVATELRLMAENIAGDRARVATDMKDLKDRLNTESSFRAISPRRK